MNRQASFLTRGCLPRCRRRKSKKSTISWPQGHLVDCESIAGLTRGEMALPNSRHSGWHPNACQEFGATFPMKNSTALPPPTVQLPLPTQQLRNSFEYVNNAPAVGNVEHPLYTANKEKTSLKATILTERSVRSTSVRTHLWAGLMKYGFSETGETV